jgi:dipeptidyl aminopeptidase/acylaminoacyl peptidase
MARPVYDLQGVRIRSTDGLIIYGHLSYPARGGPRPTVAYVTPRGAKKGRYEYKDYVLDLAEEFNGRGYVFCAIDRRGSEGYSEEFRQNLDLGGMEVDDVLAGTHWLLQQHFVDPQRIVLAGSSQGAVAAALALAREDLYGAAILDSGFYDLAFQYGYEWATGRTMLRTAAHVSAEQYEHFLQDFPHPERSPTRQARFIRVPVLLLHGEDDQDVPLEQSVCFQEALRAAGREVTLATLPDCPHGCLEDPRCWRPVEAFLRKYVSR